MVRHTFIKKSPFLFFHSLQNFPYVRHCPDDGVPVGNISRGMDRRCFGFGKGGLGGLGARQRIYVQIYSQNIPLKFSTPSFFCFPLCLAGSGALFHTHTHLYTLPFSIFYSLLLCLILYYVDSLFHFFLCLRFPLYFLLVVSFFLLSVCIVHALASLMQYMYVVSTVNRFSHSMLMLECVAIVAMCTAVLARSRFYSTFSLSMMST